MSVRHDYIHALINEELTKAAIVKRFLSEKHIEVSYALLRDHMNHKVPTEVKNYTTCAAYQTSQAISLHALHDYVDYIKQKLCDGFGKGKICLALWHTKSILVCVQRRSGTI